MTPTQALDFERAKSYLLDRAAERNVAIEVLAVETRELTIESFDAALSDMRQASRGGIGVRVVTGGRSGYASSEDLRPEALDWLLAEAIENAELQEPRGAFLPAGQALGSKDLLSEGLSAPIEEKAARAQSFERALRDDPRTQQVSIARYSEREVRSSLASSNGADGAYRNGVAMLMGSLVMKEGDSIKQGWEVELAKEFHSLDPQRTALDLTTRTGRLLGARPLRTGRYRAYLEPKVVGMLLRVLAFALSGKAVVEGKSALADKLGQPVASPLLTLIDDPTLADGLASRPFDAEGTPARRTPLITEGVLVGFLHNSETAHQSGHENTGHASRSYDSPLTVAPSNLLLEPGAGVPLERGVVVTQVMGLHAGANPISGDLSVQGLGLLVENGEVAYPVENFALSGNLFELLPNIVAVGDDAEWVYSGGAVRTPTVAIDGFSFGGA